MVYPKVAKLGPNSIFADKEKLSMLITLYEDGVKWGEIEERMGVSYGACYNALRAAGILGKGGSRYRRLDEKERKKLIKEYQKGVTIEKLRKKYNVTRLYCCGVIREHGLSCQPKRVFLNNPQMVEALKRDYEAKMPWKAITEKYGMSVERCRNYLHYAGVPMTRKRVVVLDDEKRERCVEDYLNDMPIKDIAIKYDIPEARVYELLKVAKVYQKKLKTAEEFFQDKELVGRILDVYRSFMPFHEMEQVFKLNKSTIRKILEMAGEPKRDSTVTWKNARRKK